MTRVTPSRSESNAQMRSDNYTKIEVIRNQYPYVSMLGLGFVAKSRLMKKNLDPGGHL